MFTLTLVEENIPFQNYLNDFSTESKQKEYQFTTRERGSEMISKYINYELRRSAIEHRVEKYRLKTEEKQIMFNLYPENSIYKTYTQILKKTKEMIKNENELHFSFEGFVRFRLKEEKQEVEKYVESACQVVLGNRKNKNH